MFPCQLWLFKPKKQPKSDLQCFTDSAIGSADQGVPTGYCLRERARRSYVCLAPVIFFKLEGLPEFPTAKKAEAVKSCWNLFGVVGVVGCYKSIL